MELITKLNMTSLPTNQWVQILLRHADARAQLLAPLGSVADCCWLILLKLYATNSERGYPLRDLAHAMKLTEPQLARYVVLMAETGFVEVEAYMELCQLSAQGKAAVENAIVWMDQDCRSSLES